MDISAYFPYNASMDSITRCFGGPQHSDAIDFHISKYRLKSVLFLIIYFGISFSISSYMKTKDLYYPDDKWRISTPEEQGINSEKILAMFRKIRSSTLDFHSILIIRNGFIVTEAYWAPYNKNTPHNIKSASKSIISALVGIALKEKYLNNLHQKISEFFPEYVQEPRKQDISLYDLLTMKAGFNWMEDSGPSPYDLENWIKIPMRDKPGEKFEYNTMLPHMMSAILTKVSGESTKNFADKYLFTPLGIKSYQWTKSSDGYYHGGSDIFLTPRDMAKIGYLFLNNGRWNQRQLVAEEWVKESTSLKVKIPDNVNYAKGLDYGYWWWIQEKGYIAWGAGGQYIIVRPDLDLVIVITANGFNDINHYHGFMKSFLEENIYSAIKSDSPLPANSSAFQELSNTILEIENPKEIPNRSLPKTAAKISNNNYIFEPNKMGFKSTIFTFAKNAACSWKYCLGDKKITMQVGLKGNYILNKIDFSMGVHPDGEEIACKGYWKNDDTFIIEHHIIGDPSKQIFELLFDGKNVTMNISTFGMNATIKGIIEK
jgi:CubicO group peptidase (beta-lactamase class C family)